MEKNGTNFQTKMIEYNGKRFRLLRRRIPIGIYCYDHLGVCPFWDIDEDAPEQDNGYCHLLGEGDHDDDALGLLWDQVKCCGINDDLEEERKYWENK